MTNINFSVLADDSSRLDIVKDRVMVANNAKSIYDHIVSLENDPKHRQRWIWELMQNAQDSNAKDITVSYRDDVLEFKHNGDCFSEEDIAHVILHGSSKPEDKTGKFGTGFMTTHLLSTKVRIRGNLEGDRNFDFELDRTGHDPVQMKASLDISWQNLKNSIKSGDEYKDSSFIYVELNDKGKEAIENVLKNIQFFLPPVLAFSKIENVYIHFNNESFLYRKVHTDLQMGVTVAGLKNVVEPFYTQSFLIHELENKKGQLAIPVNADGDITVLDKRIPRLFITFPLIGTAQAFPFPFLINSAFLQPSAEREKLWLSSDSNTPQIKANKEILELVLTDFIAVLKNVLQENRGNVHLLANLGAFHRIDWVDSDWYQKLIMKTVKEIDQLPLIVVAKENEPPIALSQAKILVSELNGELGDENFTWQLCNYLFADNIPNAQLANYWRNVLNDRISFQSGAKHPSAFTVKDLCEKIDKVENHQLSAIASINIEPVMFIQRLVTGLEEFKLEKYWSEYALLPAQSGYLKTSTQIKQELLNDSQEIGEDLKDIATFFGSNLREQLLHKQIIIVSETQKLAEFQKDTVVASLLQIARNKELNNLTPDLQTGFILLFEWLLQHDQLNELAGFPVRMHSEKWEKMQLGKELFLFPIALWGSGFQKYAELFPDDFILNFCYVRILSKEILAEKAFPNWLLKCPLYYESGELSSDEIRAMVTKRTDKIELSRLENAEWKMTGRIRLSKIAYFTAPSDRNVIDKARSANIRTRNLLEMIVDVLLNEDEYGFTRHEIVVKADATTKSIGVYPNRWLYEIKNRNWVRESGNKISNRPSVETLLNYFKQADTNEILYSSLAKPKIARFLNFLDIGVGDLLRNIRSGENEEERIGWDQSYATILMNKDLTPQKVSGLLGDPNFIIAYEKKQMEDEWRQQNQEIGTKVEDAFRKAFENLTDYKIKREPIGSDYIIECDCPHVLVIEKENKTKFLVEIKSSRSAEVRMTYTQGKTAYEKMQSYLLCVVPLDGSTINTDTVIANARFITNIAALLHNRVERVLKISETQQDAIRPVEGDDPNISTAIEGTNIRYVIGQKIWLDQGPRVLSFQSFIDGLEIHNIP